jgi:hypothetical protein
MECHGRSKYVKGCRCDVCVVANREYQRQYMKVWRSKKLTETPVFQDEKK